MFDAREDLSSWLKSRAGAYLASVLLTLHVAGCNASPAKYDPVHDQSTISGPTHEVSWLELTGTKQTFQVQLSGKGKHPKEWSGALWYVVYRPASSADVLGEHPKIEHSTLFYSYEGSRFTDKFGEEVNESAMFDMSLDNIVKFVDYNGYTLNGKSIQLTKEQRESIQQTVAAARAVTNGD